MAAQVSRRGFVRTAGAALGAMGLLAGAGCSGAGETDGSAAVAVTADVADADAREAIESALNLANNESAAWTYSSQADAWTLATVPAVAYPELEDYEGVSVCVPGAYVTGLDTTGDGTAGASKAMPGFDVIDYGQEDYVFGSSEADARHWDRHVLDVFQNNADTLESLFNA